MSGVQIMVRMLVSLATIMLLVLIYQYIMSISESHTFQLITHAALWEWNIASWALQYPMPHRTLRATANVRCRARWTYVLRTTQRTIPTPSNVRTPNPWIIRSPNPGFIRSRIPRKTFEGLEIDVRGFRDRRLAVASTTVALPFFDDSCIKSMETGSFQTKYVERSNYT